jgi:hypothetical protein
MDLSLCLLSNRKHIVASVKRYCHMAVFATQASCFKICRGHACSNI